MVDIDVRATQKLEDKEHSRWGVRHSFFQPPKTARNSPLRQAFSHLDMEELRFPWAINLPRFSHGLPLFLIVNMSFLDTTSLNLNFPTLWWRHLIPSRGKSRKLCKNAVTYNTGDFVMNSMETLMFVAVTDENFSGGWSKRTPFWERRHVVSL